MSFSNSTTVTGDGDAVLVGMPRLRQLRVKKGAKIYIFQQIYVVVNMNKMLLLNSLLCLTKGSVTLETYALDSLR